MNRNIKTIIKIIVTILIALTVLLILPKEDAALSQAEIDNLKNGGTIFCNVGSLDDKSIYCIEKGQNLWATYKIKTKIEINDNTVTRTTISNGKKETFEDKDGVGYTEAKFVKGIMYILSQRDTNTYGHYGDVQLALWEYIRLAYDRELGWNRDI